jgi:hypothetical protein
MRFYYPTDICLVRFPVTNWSIKEFDRIKIKKRVQNASRSFKVAPIGQNLNKETTVTIFDNERWVQIYEELKQLYQLKDLIEPLEAKRLKEQQEQTQSEQGEN